MVLAKPLTLPLQLMNNMRGLSHKTRAFAPFLAVGLMLALPTAATATDLVVDFENTPLFSEANFLPGDTVTRWAKVHNNTESNQHIIVEAINGSDPDGLGDDLLMRIADMGTTYFDGSMADFLDAGEIALGALIGGNTRQYDFSVSFAEEADDDAQGKSLSFDILIGFQGGTTTTDNIAINGRGSGGSTSGLLIFNEAEINVLQDTATLTWNTNYNSTSRVVYGTTASVFDFNNLPNYGYPNSSAELDTPASTNGVTFHSVTLVGLIPNTTYYYRVISHASPDTVSVEHSFTTEEIFDGVGGPPLGGESQDEESGSGMEDDDRDGLQQNGKPLGGGQASPSNSISTGGDDKSLLSVLGGGEEDEKSSGATVEFLAASLFGLPGPWWLWILLAGLVLYWLFVALKQRRKNAEGKSSQ
jgi:hypothetical protein